MNKKAQVMSNLGALGIGVASLLIVLVVAFLIMAESQDTMEDAGASQACYNQSDRFYVVNSSCERLGATGGVTGTSIAWNSTYTLQTATATIPGWVSIIIITAIGSILIGMVAMFRR